jgi:uncharacterized repeat protein (TIGR01451 family)
MLNLTPGGRLSVRHPCVLVVLVSLVAAPLSILMPIAPHATAAEPVSAPVLKWQRGGCYSSWCETGWYSSAAVADLDGDGQSEVIGAAYSLFVVNGADGALRWRADPPGSRVWPGVVVADLDRDGDLEIVTAHGEGYVNVTNAAGGLIWSRRLANNELRGLSVYDLDGDGPLEIIVTGAVYGKVNTWVLDHDGATRPGWPQLNNDTGYAYGVFNANAAIGNLDADGEAEIIVPSDVHYICAYQPDGAPLPAHAMYGSKAWGAVGVWESLATELRGWGQCSGARAERYRTNFAHGPAVIADVNGDGVHEVIVTGNVYDCATANYQSRYTGVYVFNRDRSRFNRDGFDWRNPPTDTGAPLSEDWNVIENAQPNPALADLDGDGRAEIVFAAYDGRLHAFWLDRTEHGRWPYRVHNPAEGFMRFASEPAVADLDNDGRAEVVFASWTENGSQRSGRLHILDALGNPLHVVDLPAGFGYDAWNGALAAPTLANIDADADLEVVLNTAHSGLVAYDLPGTANARLLWATGRGNAWRTGSWLGPTLSKAVDRSTADQGDVLHYSLTLAGAGRAVVLTDTIPSGTAYVPGSARVTPAIGSLDADAGAVRWNGVPAVGLQVRLTFAVTVTAAAPLAIVNRAIADDGQQATVQAATTIVNGHRVYLPAVQRR